MSLLVSKVPRALERNCEREGRIESNNLSRELSDTPVDFIPCVLPSGELDQNLSGPAIGLFTTR